MNSLIPTSCAALLLLAGCLENEESITIASDGSAKVRVSSSGDRADLSFGSPIPQFGPWVGNAERQAESEQQGNKQKVSVKASFARVEDLSHFYAPRNDPYRSASLERTASLEIKVRGKHKIYIFERRYHSPGQGLRDPINRLLSQMPDEIEEESKKKDGLSAKSWRWIHRTLLEEYQLLADSYVREACIALFLEEGSGLTSSDMDRILASSEASLTHILALGRLQDIYRQMGVEQDLPKEQRPEQNPLQVLEQEIRTAMRTALTKGLQQAGLGEELRNRALGTFEWWLAASDHTDDLGDESFKITVDMPGRIIAGNFDELTARGAIWKIGGGILGERDVTMRVISIVE